MATSPDTPQPVPDIPPAIEPQPPVPTPGTPGPDLPDLTDDPPPETVNRSQEDEAAQAQTIAAQAQGLAQEPPSPGESVKAPVNPADFIEEDVQDLVEHMLAMTASGQIDMGAYRDERDDSDVEENAPRQMRER